MKFGDNGSNPQLEQDKDFLSRGQLLSRQNMGTHIAQLSQMTLLTEKLAKICECFCIKDGVFVRNWNHSIYPRIRFGVLFTRYRSP